VDELHGKVSQIKAVSKIETLKESGQTTINDRWFLLLVIDP